jgi:hypothetical protein
MLLTQKLCFALRKMVEHRFESYPFFMWSTIILNSKILILKWAMELKRIFMRIIIHDALVNYVTNSTSLIWLAHNSWTESLFSEVFLNHMIADHVSNLKPFFQNGQKAVQNRVKNYLLVMWLPIILPTIDFWVEISKMVKQSHHENHLFVM